MLSNSPRVIEEGFPGSLLPFVFPAMINPCALPSPFAELFIRPGILMLPDFIILWCEAPVAVIPLAFGLLEMLLRRVHNL